MSTDALRERISEIVAPPADELLVAFFSSTKTFDGGLFNTLPQNPRDTFSTDDLLALAMLDVAPSPLAVRRLLSEPDYSLLLADVRDDVDLWDATDEDLEPAHRLWHELRGLHQVGQTRASKLLARKRPKLIPIVDSVVRRSYGLTFEENSWLALRDALMDRQLRDQIHAIRPADLPTTITTLRLLDVAAWMRGSLSKYAKRERKALGL